MAKVTGVPRSVYKGKLEGTTKTPATSTNSPQNMDYSEVPPRFTVTSNFVFSFLDDLVYLFLPGFWVRRGASNFFSKNMKFTSNSQLFGHEKNLWER